MAPNTNNYSTDAVAQTPVTEKMKERKKERKLERKEKSKQASKKESKGEKTLGVVTE